MPAAADDVLLRTYLHEREAPCPRCGYNLRDLQADGCPECGEQLVLQLGAARQPIRLLITGLIGLMVGGGFSLMCLGFIAWQVWVVNARNYALEPFFIISTAGFLIHAAAVGLWLWRWRWLQRCSTGFRITMAGLGWVLSLINLVVFCTHVR